MPARNLLVLCLAAIISLACYHRASHNRYAVAVADAIGQIDANFVEPIDRRDLFEGSMEGMVKRLDDYSGFVSPDDYDELLEDLDQEFGGVGIIVDVDPDTERLMVLSPFLGTPAYEAGIRAGDLIMAIEGQDTAGMNSSDTVKLIRGKPGTPVQLTIKHYGQEESKEVTLVRAIIPVESVLGDTRNPDGSWEFVLEDHPEIGYLRLTSFGENSAKDLTAALEKVIGNVDGLILDLRQNPGGLLEASVEVCDLFLNSGDIVSIRGRGKVLRQEYSASKGTVVPTELPMVVLVDHYSASAAEIVSACFQDHERAIVVGERSWGKGTVQSVYELEGGRSALRLTTATYWRPNGRNIHRLAKSNEEDEWGVSPNDGYAIKYEKEEFLNILRARRQKDVVLVRSRRSEDVTDSVSTDTDEQAPAEDTNAGDEADSVAAADAAEDTGPVVDRQLELAIEYLKDQISGEQAESPPAKKAA